jgi:hypothetical protein
VAVAVAVAAVVIEEATFFTMRVFLPAPETAKKRRVRESTF